MDDETRRHVDGIVRAIERLDNITGPCKLVKLVAVNALNASALAKENKFRGYVELEIPFSLDPFSTESKSTEDSESEVDDATDLGIMTIRKLVTRIVTTFDSTMCATAGGRWAAGKTAYTMTYHCRSNGKNRASLRASKTPKKRRTTTPLAEIVPPSSRIPDNLLKACCSHVSPQVNLPFNS